MHGNGFAVNLGGKSANQAVAASLLGATVSLVGAVGDDSNGEMLIYLSFRRRSYLGHVRTAPAETGVAVIAVDANGENNIIISAGANGTLSPADVAAAADVIKVPPSSASASKSAWTRCWPPRRQGTTPAQQWCSTSRLTRKSRSSWRT